MPQPNFAGINLSAEDDYFLRLFYEENGFTFDPLLSYNGSGFITGQKVGGIFTAVGGLYSAFQNDASPSVLKWQVDNVRKDVVHSNWMADTITGMTGKIVNGWTGAEGETKALLVTEAILSGFQVAYAARIMMMQFADMKLAADIREFHNKLKDDDAYVDENQRTLLTEGTNAKDMIEAHREFIERAPEKLQAAQAESAVAAANVTAAKTAMDAAQSASTTAQDAMNEAEENFQAAYIKAQDNLEAYERATNAMAELSGRIDELTNSLTEPGLRSDRIADINAEIEALREKYNEALHESLDAKGNMLPLNDKLTMARDRHVEASEVQQGASEQAAVATNSHDAAVRNEQAANNRVEALNNALIGARELSNDFNYGSDNKWANSGMFDNALSALRIGAGLGAVATAGDANPEVLAALGLSVTSESFYALSSAASHSEAEKLFNDTSNAGKLAAVFGGLAAATGLAGAGAGIHAIASQLDNPNLTDQERAYLQAELGLQGTVMTLSAVDGMLTGLVAAGKIGGQAALKAIPILGGVASVASAINPAAWAEFDSIRDRIDSLNPEESETDRVLANVLDESLFAKEFHYGLSASLDIAFGGAAAGLAATGVGAPLAIGVAIAGAIFSGIVRATEQAHLEAIADDMARDMKSGGRTIEEFFDMSFEERQQELREGYKEHFDELLEGDYDAAVGLGSQMLSANDLSAAAISKTGGELNKTAKHYADTYTTEGGWDASAIQLTEKVGNDEIRLADRGEDKVYLTFMAPLLASGDESTQRKKTGKDEYRTTLKIDDLAGWTVIDSGDNDTTFNMVRVINHTRSLSGREDTLEFNVEAGAGDDTYFGYDSAINFDGGTGMDTASYTRLGTEVLETGIFATASGNRIDVSKSLRADSEVFKEFIGTYTENHGKRTETIEYRGVRLEERGSETVVSDALTNVERLHGTDMNDVLDMRGSTVVEQLFGFGGDDIMILGEKTSVALAGEGEDMIYAGLALMEGVRKMAEGTATLDDAILIDGGAGIDRLYLDDATHAALRGQFAEQQYASAMSAMLGNILGFGSDAQTIADALEQYLSRGTGDDFALSVFHDVEFVQFDIAYADVPYQELSATVVTVDVYDTVERLNAEALGDYAADRDADRSHELDGAFWEDIGAGELRYYQGQIYLVAGETYEFRETVDDYAQLFVGGQEVLHDSKWDDHATGTYTATETGWVEYDFYVQNVGGPGNARLDVRNVDGGSFEQVMADIRLENLLGFESRMLNGDLTGDETLDSIWHVSDFQQLIDDVLTGPTGLPFETRNGLLETYDNVTGVGNAAQLEDVAAGRQADNVERMTNGIDGVDILAETLKVFSGEIWLEAGETYSFRETVDNFGLLKIGGDTVIEDVHFGHHQTGEYTAEVSGWHPYELYAWNKRGPGIATLEIKTEDMADYIVLDAEMQMSVALSNRGGASSVTIIGDALSNDLEGGRKQDTLFGDKGHDILAGREGVDVLSGGADADTFVFHKHFGHDLIVEATAEHWGNNRLIFADWDLSDIERTRQGEDLILWTDTNNSVTLKDYFAPTENGLRKAQFIEDRDGDVFVFDQDTSVKVLIPLPGPDASDLVLFASSFYTMQDRSMVAARDAAFSTSERAMNAMDALDALPEFKDGTFEQGFLDHLRDQFVL